MRFPIEQCQPSETNKQKKRVTKNCDLFLTRDPHQIYRVSGKTWAQDLVLEVRSKKKIL